MPEHSIQPPHNHRPLFVDDPMFACYMPGQEPISNSFLTAAVEKRELPHFENIRPLLPQPSWSGHSAAIECYWQAWEIAFGNLCRPTPLNGFVSNYLVSITSTVPVEVELRWPGGREIRQIKTRAIACTGPDRKGAARGGAEIKLNFSAPRRLRVRFPNAALRFFGTIRSAGETL
jgi:hypothetical protein